MDSSLLRKSALAGKASYGRVLNTRAGEVANGNHVRPALKFLRFENDFSQFRIARIRCDDFRKNCMMQFAQSSRLIEAVGYIEKWSAEDCWINFIFMLSI